MTPKVPTSDNGTDRLGMIVARALRRNTKITSTTSTTASMSSNSTSFDRGPDGYGAVADDRHIDRRRQGGLQLRQQGLDSSTTSMTLAPGWRCTLTITAGEPLSRPRACRSARHRPHSPRR